jgi:hypothetical protein
MAGPALVLVHGRNQQMPANTRRGAAEEAAFVARKKKGWLGGLAKGLVLAGLPPVRAADVRFPYFGNAFVDAIAAYDKAGGARPDLALEPGAELATDTPAQAAPPPSADTLILEAAMELGYRPGREEAEGETDTDLDSAWTSYSEGAEINLGPILRPRLLRSALQFIARKTGATELVIERFLSDVAYYLDVPKIRDLVLDIVAGEVRAAAAEHGSVVVVAHSLGSIVGYDLFDTLAGDVDVRLLVTTGSPLGFPVVRGALRPSKIKNRAAPRGKDGAAVPWLNAFDVQDFVALVHPLRSYYGNAPVDERTFNPSDPHSIADYLSDPDVARPIGRALAGSTPW